MSEATPPNEGLLSRGVGAALWSALGSAVRFGLQIAAQIVLARLLGPDAFGVFAVALAFVFFVHLFADFGLAYGLIQRPDVTDADIRFAFTWQMVLGLVTSVVLAAAAPLLARLMGDPRIAPVLAVLAATPLVAAVGATAGMLLRRRLDFRRLNIAVVTSYSLGFVAVGIPLAVLGYGVWSLVAAYLVQMAVASGMMLAAVRHPVRPLFRHCDARAIVGFGGTVFATNVLNWIMLSLDRLAVGAAMQSAAAGLYATMHNLITQPVTTIIGALQPALYAASARVQDDRQRLAGALKASLALTALFLAPVFFAIAVVAETAVLAVYGAKWAGGGVVLQPLAAAMPAFLVLGMAVPTLWASGRGGLEFRLQLPLAVAFAVLVFVVARQGSLAGLAWTVCAWFYLRACVIGGAAFRLLGLTYRDAVRLLAPGALVTAGVSLAAMSAAAVAARAGAGPLTALACVIVACAPAMLAGLYLVRDLLAPEAGRLVAEAVRRLPSARLRVLAARLTRQTP